MEENVLLEKYEDLRRFPPHVRESLAEGSHEGKILSQVRPGHG